MIGKLILTAVILGGGAFFLFSDSFGEFIGSYASAASSDIEDLKDVHICVLAPTGAEFFWITVFLFGLD